MSGTSVGSQPLDGVLGAGSWLRNFSKALRAVFLSAALAAVVAFAWQTRSELNSMLMQVQVWWLIAAALLLMAMHFLSGTCFGRGLALSGCCLSRTVALRSHIINLPARYLPGGVWHSVARMADVHANGASRRQISAYLLLENALAPGIALPMGIVFSGASGLLQPPLQVILMGIAVLFAAGILLLPGLFSRVRGHSWRPGDTRAYVELIGLLAGYWCLAAGAFYMYFQAFPAGIAEFGFTAVAGVYLVGWSAGYIAFFAPQGIGVFEWVTFYGFGGADAIPELIVLIAGFRIVVLGADMATWSAGVLYGICRSRKLA